MALSCSLLLSPSHSLSLSLSLTHTHAHTHTPKNTLSLLCVCVCACVCVCLTARLYPVIIPHHYIKNFLHLYSFLMLSVKNSWIPYIRQIDNSDRQHGNSTYMRHREHTHTHTHTHTHIDIHIDIQHKRKTTSENKFTVRVPAY